MVEAWKEQGEADIRSGTGVSKAGVSWLGVRNHVASHTPAGYLWSLRKSKLVRILPISLCLYSEAMFVL